MLSNNKDKRPSDLSKWYSRYHFCSCTVILGSTPKRPAESCLEINASGEGKLVSGNYWLKGMKLEEVYEVIIPRIINMPMKICQSLNLCPMLKNSLPVMLLLAGVNTLNCQHS